MKKVIPILAILAFFSSCTAYKAKKKARICSTCPTTTVVRDSIVSILKDTTIYVEKIGPIQYIENPCSELCDSAGNLKPGFEKVVVKDRWKTVVKVVHDSIAVETIIDSVSVAAQWVETNNYKKAVKTVTVERNFTPFEKFRLNFFWIFVALVVGYSISRFAILK